MSVYCSDPTGVAEVITHFLHMASLRHRSCWRLWTQECCRVWMEAWWQVWMEEWPTERSLGWWQEALTNPWLWGVGWVCSASHSLLRSAQYVIIMVSPIFPLIISYGSGLKWKHCCKQVVRQKEHGSHFFFLVLNVFFITEYSLADEEILMIWS